MLFQTRFHEAIRRGELTCTLRIWKTPRVRVGASYSLGSGSIIVERIHEIGFDDITPAIARRTGFSSVIDLLKTAKHGAGERVFLIDFRYSAAPKRQAPAATRASETERTALLEKLQAMDRRALRPWTRDTLRSIATHPGVRAADLAAGLGRPRDEFKTDVRKLKALGLTESLDTGYRLSVRGEQVVAAVKKRR